MGGEKISTTSWPRCWKGSPPRGRGKVNGLPFAMSGVGITPAWAGKSQTLHFNSHRTGDHPRVGGEKAKGKPKSQGHLGSPPRGRGKVETISSNSRAEGITPAWAGKSRAAVPAEQLIRDHPRVGGEKYAGRRHRGDLKGSPPRGRGKGQLHPWAAFHAGITPAWAGKSKRPAFPVCVMWDHPRVGGEKGSSRRKSGSSRGSPPRGRGKALDDDTRSRTRGITPAWAGKSFFLVEWNYKQKDHPRVGGEKVMLFTVSVHALGSPPRGRGKVLL